VISVFCQWYSQIVATVEGLRMGIGIRNRARNSLVDIKKIYPLLIVALFFFTALPSWAAPTAPSNLRRTYMSDTRIDLAWDASTDSIGVAGYRIYDDVTSTLLATTNLTSCSFTGLDIHRVYRHYVIAYNGVGDISAPSATVTTWPRPLPATTPVGTNVLVNFVDNYLTVTFSQVTTAGQTWLTAYEPHRPLPAGFRFQTSRDIPSEFMVNDISTNAVYNGPVTVSHPYDESLGTPRLFHWENGAWKDVTVSVDTVNKQVIGRATSLSPFMVAFSLGSGAGSSGRGYSTGVNENRIALIAILAILAGVFILRRHRLFRKS
jgi:hypothetical protein